jgi:hypothetical protein
MWNQRITALDPQQRAKIVELRREGITIESIAKRYAVSPATVSRIESRS